MGSSKVKYILNEVFKKRLTEDRVVKFDGQTNPPYGWCLLLCGGSGVGKSTTYNGMMDASGSQIKSSAVPFIGKKYDVDSLKQEGKYYTISQDEYEDHIITFYYLNGTRKFNLEAAGIKPPFTLKNPDFTSFVHDKQKSEFEDDNGVMKPGLTKRIKNQMFKSGENAPEDRLPNIVFDITGEEKSGMQSIIQRVSDIGYKVAVVYVLGDIKQSVSNNYSRNRVVDIDIVLKAHRGALRTIRDITDDSALMSKINEMYIVLNTSYVDSSNGKEIKYLDDKNVYRIKTADDFVQFPKRVRKAQQKALDDVNKAIKAYDNGEDVVNALNNNDTSTKSDVDIDSM